jgi:hypothetical protein
MNGWKMRKEGDVLSVERLRMLNLRKSRRRASGQKKRSERAARSNEEQRR